MPIQTLRMCFLVSGGGTTMGAILEAIRTKKLEGVEPKLVIASRPGIAAIERAHEAGMACHNVLLLSPRNYHDPKRFARRIIEECEIRGVNFIGQYGWMPKTPEPVVRRFAGMIVNQHPGPLDPAAPPGFDFGGEGMFGRRVMAARLLFVRSVERAWWTLATTHHVLPEFDRGGVIGESLVDIHPDTTLEDLKLRMSQAEHRLQIRVLRDFVQGTVRVAEHKSHWLVRPEEKDVLDKCKAEAAALYPNG